MELKINILKKSILKNKRYKPIELISKYHEFDAYIGMRLHGAILSMLGGTPAFNIGYEDKTKGIYEFLELSDYNIDYTAPIDNWIEKISDFLKNLKDIELSLEEKQKERVKLLKKTLNLYKYECGFNISV